MSSVIGQTIAIGNLIYIGDKNSIITDNDKLKIFI